MTKGMEETKDIEIDIALVECPHCSWEGREDELEMDYYEPYLSPMALESLCPNCENDIS